MHPFIRSAAGAPRRTVPRFAVALSALAFAACNDAPSATGVRVPVPIAAILDGAHGGNPGFYFLPPLAEQPASMPAADMSVDPVVEICAWTGSACAGIAATYTTSTGSGGEVVRADADGSFIVNWDTDQFSIGGATVYRIRVLLNESELGHVDVELVSGGQALRTTDSEAPIALLDGRTLPIRFRVTEGAVPPPTLSPRDERETMASGGVHSCALDTAGQAWCWGSNLWGELGTGSSGGSFETPQAVTGNHVFTSIVAMPAATCALDALGVAWCWGANSDGQLGRGTVTTKEPVPEPVTGGHTFAALSAGSFFICGRTPAGEIWCWGYGVTGSLGNGAYLTSPTPVKVTAPGIPAFARLEVGGGHGCGLTAAGTAWCWGLNDQGQLGRDTITLGEATPAIAAGGQPFASLAAGGHFTCALDAAGATSCWGGNSQGQLGRGTVTGAETSAAPVNGAEPFVRLTAGLEFVCGQTVTGTVWCWGDNQFAQLGTGAISPVPDNAVPTPQAVLEGANWPVLAPGFFHTCAIAFDGSGRCWGNNASRQSGVPLVYIVPEHTTIGPMTFALP